MINEQTTVTDTISRQAAIDLIEDIETERLKGNIELIYAAAIKGLRALPPAQPEIVPCNYVKACNEATMDKLTSAVRYLGVLEELKKHGYVLVDMRGTTK